jgi:phosphatidylglycerophosphate synthase
VARQLNQCSDVGGLLDMVTDRCSTLGLLFVLSGDYGDRDVELGFPVFRLVREK